MGQPCLLVDNFFNTRIYGSHAITALENSSDALLVGAARRSAYDAYNSLTTNADAWIKARCGVPRLADMIIVERGNNQGGKTVKAQVCDDDFVGTPQDAFNSVTPSSAGTGSLDDGLGVRTPEGAWLKRFSARGGHDWRYYVPALGVGLVCTVPGLWIGLSWRPGYVDRPFAPYVTQLIVQEVESDQGWRGRGKATPRRQGVLHFTFNSLFDGELAGQQLIDYAHGRPMWIIPDDEQADQAFLATCPGSVPIGLELQSGDFYPKLDVPFIELDPSET
jgi:hypothetical protein